MSDTFYTVPGDYINRRMCWKHRYLSNNVALCPFLVLSVTDGDLFLDYIVNTSGPIFRSLSCSTVHL